MCFWITKLSVRQLYQIYNRITSHCGINTQAKKEYFELFLLKQQVFQINQAKDNITITTKVTKIILEKFL